VETLTDLRPLKRLEMDLATLRHDAMPVRSLGRLVGSSRPILDVYDRIRLAGDSEVTVLIEGETGTGKELIAEGVFREDFYYRIRVLSIAVPALREHKEDIPLLCETFVKKLNGSTGKHITRLLPQSGRFLFLEGRAFATP